MLSFRDKLVPWRRGVYLMGFFVAPEAAGEQLGAEGRCLVEIREYVINMAPRQSGAGGGRVAEPLSRAQLVPG